WREHHGQLDTAVGGARGALLGDRRPQDIPVQLLKRPAIVHRNGDVAVWVEALEMGLARAGPRRPGDCYSAPECIRIALSRFCYRRRQTLTLQGPQSHGLVVVGSPPRLAPSQTVADGPSGLACPCSDHTSKPPRTIATRKSAGTSPSG